MNAYPAERKEAVLRRMMPPENKALSALARETGITEQTTRIVPINEAALAHLPPPSRSQPAARKSVAPINTSTHPLLARPLALGNDRAVMYLEVSFAEKDEAKCVGAKWDKDMRKWYAPHGVDINMFRRWWPDDLKKEMMGLDQL